MNRNFYFLGIFFTGLLFLTGLIQSIFYLQLGGRIFTLEYFMPWFFVVNFISLFWILILLRYFHHKNYWFTFFTGILAAIASLCHTILFYNLLVGREIMSYLPFTFMATMGAGIILYGLSLIFSAAGNRPWLKIAGICIFFLDLFLLITGVWALQTGDIETKITMEKYQQWASLAGNIIPLLFILNFWSEQQEEKEQSAQTTLQKSFYAFMGVAGTIALFFALVSGQNLAGEANWFVQQPVRAPKVAQPFEARTYVNSAGDTLKYRFMKPLNYDPQKKYLIVITLHGGAGSGTDNIIKVDGSWTAQILSKQENREKYPAFIFVPQCPPGASWGVIPKLTVVDTLVFDAIIALEEEFEIDRDRRYVMGEFLGGYGSWHFISTRPEMFAAAVPICGGGDPTLAQNIVDVPVWAFHGQNDRIVPVERSREMIEAIKNAGGNPRYTEFPDEGHIILESFENTPGLLEWVFEQKRE